MPASPPDFSLHHLIALPLDEARALLQSEDAWRDYEVRLTETAPPQRPPRKNSKPRKTPSTQHAVSTQQTPRPEPRFGQWRVTRALLHDGVLELLIARELLGETRIETPGETSAHAPENRPILCESSSS